jgi:hypothetical protein
VRERRRRGHRRRLGQRDSVLELDFTRRKAGELSHRRGDEERGLILKNRRFFFCKNTVLLPI